MNVIQTYQQGGRHKTNNQPCEDRTYSLSKNGVDVIALADGAGSSKYTHSAEGAECVTKTISEFFCNNFDKFYEKENNEELSAVIMTVCQRALQKKVEELSLDGISRLSSTLLCVAIKDQKVVSCHIGDGVIGKLTSKGTEVVSSPENGEFASTTFFITNPNADKYIHINKEILNDTISYFLMSDGTSDYIYNRLDNSFYDATKKMALMTLEEDGQANLESTVKDYMVNKDTKSDDCSFICLSIDANENITFTKVDDADEKVVIVKTDEVEDTSTQLNDKELSLIIDSFDKTKNKSEERSNSGKASRKNKKTIVFVLVVLAIVIAFASSYISKSHNKSDNTEKTSHTVVSTTSEVKSEVNTTEGSTDSYNDNTTLESATTDSFTNVSSNPSSEETDKKTTSNQNDVYKSLRESTTVQKNNTNPDEDLYRRKR